MRHEITRFAILSVISVFVGLEIGFSLFWFLAVGHKSSFLLVQARLGLIGLKFFCPAFILILVFDVIWKRISIRRQ